MYWAICLQHVSYICVKAAAELQWAPGADPEGVSQGLDKICVVSTEPKPVFVSICCCWVAIGHNPLRHMSEVTLFCRDLLVFAQWLFALIIPIGCRGQCLLPSVLLPKADAWIVFSYHCKWCIPIGSSWPQMHRKACSCEKPGFLVRTLPTTIWVSLHVG